MQLYISRTSLRERLRTRTRLRRFPDADEEEKSSSSAWMPVSTMKQLFALTDCAPFMSCSKESPTHKHLEKRLCIFFPSFSSSLCSLFLLLLLPLISSQSVVYIIGAGLPSLTTYSSALNAPPPLTSPLF